MFSRFNLSVLVKVCILNDDFPDEVLFLVCLLKIFEPYANFWLTPLMEMVLKMFQDEGQNGKGLNYFVVDILVTMLFWSTKAIPEVSDVVDEGDDIDNVDDVLHLLTTILFSFSRTNTSLVS